MDQEQQPKKRGGFAGNPELARQAGIKGSRTVKERLGTDWYKQMGESGGAAVKEKYGRDYYRRIGSEGAKKRWERERQRRAEGR